MPDNVRDLPSVEPCSVVRGQVINLKVARLRITVLRGKRWWRMAEPCLLMAAFVTLGMLLPLAFPCTPTQCYIEQGQTQPVCPPGVSPNVQCAPQRPAKGGACQCLTLLVEKSSWHNETEPVQPSCLGLLHCAAQSSRLKH